MYYVYLLKSKLNGQTYVGSTNDLRRRIKQHNDGKEISTKRYKPWILLYYEAYIVETWARLREQRLKYNGNAIRELKKRIGLINRKSGAGFTLIELLVVLGVLAILMVIGIAGLVAYSREQSLRNAAREVRTNLRFAQSKAVVGEKPTNCTGTLTGYRLDFTSGTNYIIRALCGTEITVASFRLPSDVQKNSGTSSITFAVSTGSIGGATSITLTSTFVGSEVINIDASGVIK